MKTKFLVSLSFILISWNLYSQKNFGDFYPVDSIFFEHNTIPYQIISTPGNCWQVGHPSKTFFNEAFSLPLAMVTDTVLSYPVNTQSSFSFAFKNYESGATFLGFLHKYDTDTLTDYGTIEVSYDHGLNWEVMKDSTCQNMECVRFYWSADINMSTGTTSPHLLQPGGHTNDWILSRFIWWWWMPVSENSPNIYPDSLYVRFTFHSDNIQTNKEGWMIDDIITGIMDVGSGIPVQNAESKVSVSPNPLLTVSQVQYSGSDANCVFEISDLLGRKIFSQPIDPEGRLFLNRHDFVPGIYVWNLKSNDRFVQSGKLVVE